MTSKKRIGIIGAGPGGLTAGMILAKRGLDVTIYEKADRVGGRSACINVGPYKFDVGPTLLMMRNVLEDVFSMAESVTDNVSDLLDPVMHEAEHVRERIEIHFGVPSCRHKD